MATLKRISENPILSPDPEHEWENGGAFNGCAVFAKGAYHMVYRALSSVKKQNGVKIQISSIGYAKSDDGMHFKDRRLLISPSEEWEKYGCEDPRITYLDGKFYIFYTALSKYPFSAEGIKLGLAITSDFENFEKHPVTTFNSKAMALFPEEIKGKKAALLTMDTEMPPAKIALALFDNTESMWSPEYWERWYNNANSHIVHLLRGVNDQIELGAPPIKTDIGWVIIYAYIKNYTSVNKKFGVEAALLDLDDPCKVLGRTNLPLLVPEEQYEMLGNVPNVIFPSGAIVKDEMILVYYGAADTSTAIASCHFDSLLDQLRPIEDNPLTTTSDFGRFTRFEGNPILSPIKELDWQANGVFNPAAIYEDEKVHIVYRAQGKDGTSVLGYAVSKDGIHIDENLDKPIYVPRENFEKRTDSKGGAGCEDPRITKIDDRLYMTYTAYDGINPPRVALTSIALSDFLRRNWDWEKPKLISPPGVDDKDACIVKRAKGEGYIAFHRLGDVIWVDFLRDLDFPEKKYLTGGIIAQARKDEWDNVKVGIASPPIEIEEGWLLFYHAVSDPGFMYKVGAMLLDYSDPRNILARTYHPLLEPEEFYETKGQVPNVVFPCGSIVKDNKIYLYYGGADTVTCVATMSLETLIGVLLHSKL